jgi:hypothetical protein
MLIFGVLCCLGRAMFGELSELRNAAVICSKTESLVVLGQRFERSLLSSGQLRAILLASNANADAKVKDIARLVCGMEAFGGDEPLQVKLRVVFPSWHAVRPVYAWTASDDPVGSPVAMVSSLRRLLPGSAPGWEGVDDEMELMSCLIAVLSQGGKLDGGGVWKATGEVVSARLRRRGRCTDFTVPQRALVELRKVVKGNRLSPWVWDALGSVMFLAGVADEETPAYIAQAVANLREGLR